MRFQDLWLVHSLVSWVVDPLFHGCVNEGREDVDTFRQEEKHKSELRIERWQLKDRLVTKALLAEVLSGFAAQQHERSRSKQSPISRFHLVAPSSDKDVWSLPEMIDRVRSARLAYGAERPEYTESRKHLSRQLKKLGVPIDARFVSEYVDLNFRAGWADSSQNFWTTLQALLQSLGVARDRARDAANHLFVTVSTRIGALIERETILNELQSFQGATSIRPEPRFAGVVRKRRSARIAWASSHCVVTYFPDDAVLLQFADGTCGLIDCGPAAIRHLIPYLSMRSIDSLTFLALSHWHFTSYGGIPALLNAVSQIENVHVNLDGNPHADIPWRAEVQARGGLISRRAKQVVDQLLQYAKRHRTRVHFNAGIKNIYASGRDMDRDGVWGISPEMTEYHKARSSSINDLSAVFVAQVGGHRLLHGGHALAPRWPHVLQTARAAHLAIRADAFLLPHYASRMSLTAELIKALVNVTGFVALLPVSELMTQRFGNLTNPLVLDAVRASGGRIVVCGGKTPTSFVMNREGVYQALSAEGSPITSSDVL
jgi:hypothetical protein